MEVEPPTWLNKEFLTLALHGSENANPRVEITNFSLKLAVAPGNNYTSHVYRVNVEYNNEGSPDQQTISLIVKVPIEKGVIGEFSDKIDMFSTEPKIYKAVLPTISEIARCEFGPKCFLSTKKNCLVLKDLKPDGYNLCDRFKQLDIKHCRKVITSLAKFHAASVAYHHRSPEFLETFHERFYNNNGPIVEEMKAFLDPSLRLFIETLAKNDHQTMARYVSERLDKVWDSSVEFYAPRSTSLNVINHGDCWTNNILFKYDDFGDIVDVKLIDYQIVRYSSPVTDLFYFIWTSGNEDVRDNHQEELYNMYLQTLNQTLEELNCQERLSLEDINAALQFSSDSVLLIISFIVPFLLNDSDNVIDLGTLSSGDIKTSGSDDKYSAMYKSKRFQELLPGYLRQFEKIITSS